MTLTIGDGVLKVIDMLGMTVAAFEANDHTLQAENEQLRSLIKEQAAENEQLRSLIKEQASKAETS